MHYITITAVTVLLCVTITAGAAENRATSLADQIRYLVDEERSLRSVLEAKVQRIKAETASLNASIVPCQCPAAPYQKSGPEIAYTGTIQSTKSSLTANTVFNFTNDLVNIGNGLDLNTGHFVIPVSGLYGFSLTLYMDPRYWLAMKLVKNGNQILGVKTGHYYSSSTTNRQVNMATNYVIGNFSAGEEVWPQYVTSSGTRLSGLGVSTFTSVLLHAF